MEGGGNEEMARIINQLQAALIKERARADQNEKRADENEKRADENEKRADENEKRANQNEKLLFQSTFPNFNLAPTTSLNDLLRQCQLAGFRSLTDDDEVIRTYSTPLNTRHSLNYGSTEVPPIVLDEAPDPPDPTVITANMNDWKVSDLCGTVSEVPLIQGTLDIEMLTQSVTLELFNGNREQLEEFLNKYIDILGQLRGAAFDRYTALNECNNSESKKSISELTQFQPLVYALLLQMAEDIHVDDLAVEGGQGRDMEVLLSLMPVRKENLSLADAEETSSEDATAKATEQKPEYLKLTGAVDLFLIRQSTRSYLELKSPFLALHHSAARQPKDQAVGEALGVAVSYPECQAVTRGGLTDLFLIWVLISVPNGASRQVFITRRVSRMRDYLLHLLLLLCSNSCVLSLFYSAAWIPVLVKAEGKGQGEVKAAESKKAKATRNAGQQSNSSGKKPQADQPVKGGNRNFSCENCDDEWEVDMSDWQTAKARIDKAYGIVSLNKENLSLNY